MTSNPIRKTEQSLENAPAEVAAAGADLFSQFFALQKEVSNAFARSLETSFGAFPALPSFPPVWNGFGKSFPALEIKEDDAAIHIGSHLPSGIEAKDVDVSVADNCLTVSCAHEDRSEKAEKNSRYSSLTAQSYQRTIVLPEIANAEKIEARIEDGALEITIPKRKDVIQKSRKIPVRGG